MLEKLSFVAAQYLPAVLTGNSLSKTLQLTSAHFMQFN